MAVVFTRPWDPNKNPETTIRRTEWKNPAVWLFDEKDYSEDEQRRFLSFACQQLISAIPKKGLLELAETIYEIYIFYNQLPRHETPALPPPTKYKKAVFLGREERPPFVMEYDEE